MLVSLKLALEPSGDSGKMSGTMSAFLPFLGSKPLAKENQDRSKQLCFVIGNCRRSGTIAGWTCELQGINKPRSPLAQIWRNNQLRAVS